MHNLISGPYELPLERWKIIRRINVQEDFSNRV